MTMRNRIADVILGNLAPLRWTIGWVAILLGLGFAFSGADTDNYGAINLIAPVWLWGVGFVAYGISKLCSALLPVPLWARFASGFAGLFGWVYVFLSFVVFDLTPRQATEWMLAIPVVIELWLFIESIHELHEVKKGVLRC